MSKLNVSKLKYIINLACLGSFLAAYLVACTALPARAPTTASLSSDEGPTLANATIRVAGSGAVLPLARALAEGFTARHPELEITVGGCAPWLAVEHVEQGIIDVGMTTGNFPEAELKKHPDLQAITIAWVPIVIIVHPGVPVDRLSIDQTHDIFAGRIRNWHEVGGNDRPIVVFIPIDGTAHREFFEREVMNGTSFADVAVDPYVDGTWLLLGPQVAKTAGSIGLTTRGWEGDAKAVEIAGVGSTDANVRSGAYPLRLGLDLVIDGAPDGAVGSWLDFIFSEQGQAIIEDRNCVSAADQSAQDCC